jgi:hypothetical protein
MEFSVAFFQQMDLIPGWLGKLRCMFAVNHHAMKKIISERQCSQTMSVTRQMTQG